MTVTFEIDPDRLAAVTILANGSHEPDEGQMCAMEAVSWIAREPWSDHPKCASPVIGAFMRAWNDGLPDAERTALLLPFIPRLVGTAASAEVEQRRALMAADWLVRTHTPAWLRLAGMTAQADAIASLPEITAMAQIPSIRAPLEAVRKDAAAAGAAAGAAARGRRRGRRQGQARSDENGTSTVGCRTHRADARRLTPAVHETLEMSLASRSLITHDYLREIMLYDEASGLFTRTFKGQRLVSARHVGSLDKDGYLRIKINGINYGLHRLAWFYIYSVWPDKLIDHINGDRSDNRISNLRTVDAGQNMANRRVSLSSKTGIKGVIKIGNRFEVYISVLGRRKYIGSADTIETAAEMYAKKHIALWGEFSNCA